MKTAFCDTLKIGQSYNKSIPQKSLDFVEYIQFVHKMERLLFKNIF